MKESQNFEPSPLRGTPEVHLMNKEGSDFSVDVDNYQRRAKDLLADESLATYLIGSRLREEVLSVSDIEDQRAMALEFLAKNRVSILTTALDSTDEEEQAALLIGMARELNRSPYRN